MSSDALDIERNRGRDPGWRPEAGLEDGARALHAALGVTSPSPLHDVPALAGELGVGRVLLKDEHTRLGLPAFKALGASWGASWAVAEHLGAPGLAADPDALRARAQTAGDAAPTLVAATEGNHGRAVARIAARLGLAAHIVVPGHTVAARRGAIAAEGAHVQQITGGYDDAVAHAASLAGATHLVISDTAWPGYEAVPRRVVEGYVTIFAELDAQLAQLGTSADLLVVPIGVGSLAAAAARHVRRDARATRLLGLEPIDAASALASARAGHAVSTTGAMRSLMAGLNCATPSSTAWPQLQAAFDAFVAVGDDHVHTGMRRLAAAGLDRGACAGGVVGGLAALLADDGHRAALALPPDATVVLVLTEGVTDPVAFEAVVGRPPAPA